MIQNPDSNLNEHDSHYSDRRSHISEDPYNTPTDRGNSPKAVSAMDSRGTRQGKYESRRRD